jgi:hypothetical protein
VLHQDKKNAHAAPSLGSAHRHTAWATRKKTELSWDFFWISSRVHFPCYLQQSGVGNCHFHGIYNVFEFEHLIFHGICSTLVLKLFMRHASLQLGFM